MTSKFICLYGFLLWIKGYACLESPSLTSSPKSFLFAPQWVHLPALSQMCGISSKNIFPLSSGNLATECFPFARAEQYSVRRDIRAVSSVMPIPYSWRCIMWSMRSWRFGICVSRPFSSLFAISLRNTPDLENGSRNLLLGLVNNSCGSRSSILLAMFGGVKTSSLLRFARQFSISGKWSFS